MPLIVIFIIWYYAIGRNNPQTFEKLKKKFGKIVTVLILLGVFSFVVPFAIPIIMFFSPIILIVLIIAIFLSGKKNKKYREETRTERERFNVSGKQLVKAVPKRRKIVEKFNKKFDLTLTDDQIKTIVDASYISVLWESEILSMDENYNSVYEWFKSDTAWLRAYLYVFKVQEVSSDFEQQRQIVFKAFNQIFSEMNFNVYATRKDMLWELNNTYLTGFDEVTFMIAYRFLQSEGRNYDIGCGQIIRNEDETDVLARKYSQI